MKKNIYITALHMQHGGIEMAISMLSNALAKRGYQVTILSVYNLGEVAYELRKDVQVRYLTNVTPNKTAFITAKRERKFVRILKEGLYSVKVLYLKTKKMKDTIKEIEDGIVISTRNEHSILLSKYGKKNVYKIAQLHHDHEFKKKYVNDFKKKYMNIDRFVLLTDELKKEVEQMLNGYNSHTKCEVIPNFLDVVLNDVKVEKKEQTVISVGRLHNVKGFERLIDIWKIVSEKYPDWKLKIVGGGELEHTLVNKVKRLQLENNVILTGAVEHSRVLEEMKIASIYAMTSYSEAFPFVLIEAMSKALPVVAFDVRVGPRAIVEQNIDGFLVEDNDMIQYAKYIEMLICNEKLRLDMSKNALDKAKKFTEENIMKKWERILENVE